MASKGMLIAAALAAPLAALSQGMPAVPGLRTAWAAAAADPSATAPAPAEAAPAPSARKHGVLPLWGDAVRAKGFELPNPFTVMVNYYYQKSQLDIGNLQLGFNGGPMHDFSQVIQIPEARAMGSALALRPAVMIFPFLSFYALYSSGATSTDVRVSSPGIGADFWTNAKSGAQVLALGATFQMGYRGFFAVADFNASVADVERIADLVGANILSFRLGYSWKLNEEGRKIAAWGGTAGQVIDVDTKGEVRLASVLPPATGNNCASLPPALQPRCQELVNAITDPNATVQYSLDKRPVHVWNVVLGSQFALDRSWAFRAEVTFLNGRTSVLAGTEYAFDIL